MRHLSVLCLVIPGLQCGVWADAPGAAAPDGFTEIFNGHDLAGWWGMGTEDPRPLLDMSADRLAAKKQASLADINQHWRVEDGELFNDGHGLYLTTDRNYADFELLVDYKTVANADSGVYLRGVPQVQIWDTTEAGGKWSIGADKGSGGLWNNAPDMAGKDPLVHADYPFGEWNRLRIIMVGEYVTVFMNNRRVVDHARMDNYFDRERPLPRLGPIQLQTHGGEIRWRNIFIREIAPKEANAILAAHGREGFAPVFNGANLDGWAGATDNYQVIDGAIACREGQGGTLHTAEEYEDFIVRFEFNLPPRGNNGLAIRYPGHGDTAYFGMCELQVLDNSHPDYADLDPRQYHGSIYGQVAAERGYLHTPGAWNFQQVAVVGSRIQVELNGTIILDADMNDVTEFMHAKEKFTGRLRTRGHFGFAGHHDEVKFRNISIRRLENNTLENDADTN